MFVTTRSGPVFLLLALVFLGACASSEESRSETTETLVRPWSSWDRGTTGADGAVPLWELQTDAAAPSGMPVLVMAEPRHTVRSAFNLSWDPSARFEDGRIRVAVKAISGEVDQGGGPMWRVQDESNYYVCRWNPLESNFRVYVVRYGTRLQLGSAAAPNDQDWHELAVEQEGDRIRCYLDGKLALEVRDSAIPSAGGVGLWTKADAVTAFDGFEVD